MLRVAVGAEQYLDPGADRSELERYILMQRESFSKDESFMNLYIAGRDWHFVPGFDAPPDFHAAERVWYLGAKDHPGEVYITEPYIDYDTGTMCFTVSVLLADGETVAGMDLNFSKAQESILRMTRGREQTAMIVTSGGLIAGYTDMSLVGARADEKLPEYAEILRRVASSNDHDSFRVEMDGRPCVIINHPNSAYQMSADHSVSVQDTEYAEACGLEGVVALRDYAGLLFTLLLTAAVVVTSYFSFSNLFLFESVI